MKSKITLTTIVFMILAGVAAGDITTGLVAYYPFNGNANDMSGNGNNGVLGDPQLQADRFGNPNSAYYFDGSTLTDYIIVADSPSLHFTQASFSVWIYPKPPAYYVFSKDFGNGGACFQLTLNGAGLAPYFFVGKWATGEGSVSSGGLASNQWYHIAGTYDAQDLRLYIGGVLQNTTHYTAGLDTNNGKPLTIGQKNYLPKPPSQPDWPFTGAIDELRIYNRALSAADIAQLYAPVPGIASPRVTTESADPALTSATLNGSISSDGGQACQYRFSYYPKQGGPTATKYTPWSCCASTGQTFTASITGLQPRTEYVFAAEATNSAGTATGGTRGFTTLDPSKVAVLMGIVIKNDPEGHPSGPLAGATIKVDPIGVQRQTNALGAFQFILDPGTYGVTATRGGYYPQSRSVTLKVGDTKQVDPPFVLLPCSGEPTLVDFLSPNGRHFIEGIPGNLSFSAVVAWNGPPGSVYMYVAGARVKADITDLGNGLARATVTISAPKSIDKCAELTVEVVDGEGKARKVLSTGVHFSPIPGTVWPWFKYYGPTIPWSWSPSGLALTCSAEAGPRLELTVPDVLKIEFQEGIHAQLGYDLLAGTFSATRGDSIQVGLDVNIPGTVWEFSGEASGEGDGTLEVDMAGCSTPVTTPGWAQSYTGKLGLGGPAVAVLDLISPGLGTSLAELPLIQDVKLTIYFVFGDEVTGEYKGGGYNPKCYLGSTSVKVSGTVGVEGDLAWEEDDVGLTIYVGLTGTPKVEICPDMEFKGLTVRGYVGVTAFAPLLYVSEEYGVEVQFFGSGDDDTAAAELASSVRGRSLRSLDSILRRPAQGAAGPWRPIGNTCLRWGPANSLVGAQAVRMSGLLPSVDSGRSRAEILATSQTQLGGVPDEQTVLRNVVGLASPCVISHASQPFILFSLHDPNKLWYAATDIGMVHGPNGGPWSLDRVTDDQAAEFLPKMIEVGTDKVLAAWERVSGDISAVTEPGQVAPHLEIVAAWLDQSTGLWSQPRQLTSNDVVDRDPQPVAFGDVQGVLWIENQAHAMIGDANHGDRLMFAKGSGDGWNQPEVLWSDPNGGGILGLSYVAGADREGYVVFAVDRDGDLGTRADRELYMVATKGGVWQKAVQLTNDAVEDAAPTLVAPGGVPMCVWKANGVLVYSRLGNWSPRATYNEHTDANDAVTLAGVTLPMGAAIAYTTQGPNGVDIVASFYDTDLDLWSQPRQLTHDEHAESALSLACDSNDLVIAYLKTQTLRQDMDIEINGQMQHLQNIPQPGRTDLYVLRHTPGNDLAVVPGSLAIEPNNPAPGQMVTISATVENQGDLSLPTVQVRFYDGDPHRGGTPIGDVQVLPGVLIAGGRQNASVAWTVPPAEQPHEIFVVVDPNGVVNDRNLANNSASIWTVLPDLVAETCWSSEFSSKEVLLTGRVTNTGTILAGPFRTSWRLGAANGDEIGTSDIEMLVAGGTYEVTCVWDTTGRVDPNGATQVFVVVDPAGAIREASKGNNSISCMVIAPAARKGPTLEPVAFWTFDEGSGTMAYDLVGTNHGTIYGATYTQGKLGTALRFDGVDDYVDCGSGAGLSQSQLTVALWLRPEEGAGTRNVLRKGGTGVADVEYQLLLTMTGQVAGSFNKGSQNVMVRSTNALPNNEWVYVAFTRDGNEAALYVNGADRTAVSYSLTPVSGSGPLYIGRGGNQPYKGCVDDVRIYDQALAAQEIKGLYEEASR